MENEMKIAKLGDGRGDRTEWEKGKQAKEEGKMG